MATTMIQDKRVIGSLDVDAKDFSSSDVDKIEPYEENGEMAPVIWFAIYRKGEIVQRINSKYVKRVNYKQEA